MSRETKIADMRETLRFLEENSEIPLPYFGMVNSFAYEGDDVDALARVMAPCKKEVGDSYFALTRGFGSVELSVNFDRKEVCERVVVGFEQVDEKIIKAHTREIVEWKCPDSVLSHA